MTPLEHILRLSVVEHLRFDPCNSWFEKSFATPSLFIGFHIGSDESLVQLIW